MHHLGGLPFTPIPALIIRTVFAYRRMLIKRAEFATAPIQREESRRKTFDIENYSVNLPESTTWVRYRPPPASDVEFMAHVRLLIIAILTPLCTLVIGITILSIYFAIFWSQDLEGNNSFLAGIVVIITAYTNSGLPMLFSDGWSRFRTDYMTCIIMGIMIMLGNTLYPATVRLVVNICYKLSKRNKVVYKYLMDRHHHVSVHIFPGLQTRVYVMFTFILMIFGTVVTLVLDWNNQELQGHFGEKLLIAWFQSVTLRTAGINTISLGSLTTATLLVYVLLMRIKPQMYCSLTTLDPILKPTIYKKQHQQMMSKLKEGTADKSEEVTLSLHKLMDYSIINLEEKPTVGKTILKVFGHIKKLLSRNNVWLGVVVFIILMLHNTYEHTENFSIFKVLFEVVSAFGNVGSSMGYPGSTLCFSAFLGWHSKILLILVMILGRHRGLYQSMIDQEDETVEIKKHDLPTEDDKESLQTENAKGNLQAEDDKEKQNYQNQKVIEPIEELTENEPQKIEIVNEA